MAVKERDKFEEIKPDMTPMIDVTFLLLIFFIVTLKFKTLEGRLDSNLPKDMGTNTAEVDEIEKVDIVIQVGNPGRLVPDPDTETKSYPEGRLKMYKGRILRVSVGTTMFQVRTDLLDSEGLFSDLAKLRRALKGIDRAETPVTLDVREAVVYGDIIGILDLIIDEEFEKVSFSGAPEQG
jgi:biopolymer transport protein ExbD